MTHVSEYCREKERQKEYLFDVKEGFEKVLGDARAKHNKMKTIPKIQIVAMLTKLLAL